MPTGYEVSMYHDIAAIARHLERIANILEAAEERREADLVTRSEGGRDD